ncbi:MAG: S-layer homology domain-containing protein, partial [Actinomycetota bacterium]
ATNTRYQGYFPDVPPNHWAWDYIETARDRGIVKGYADGLFRPEAWVRRDQTAVMIYRAIFGPSGDVGWVREIIDLTPYCGGLATLDWRWHTDGEGVGEGMYIDDILVTGVPKP